MSLQVTIEEDSALAHPTRDRAKIPHSRRLPTKGHLMAVVQNSLFYLPAGSGERYLYKPFLFCGRRRLPPLTACWPSTWSQRRTASPSTTTTTRRTPGRTASGSTWRWKEVDRDPGPMCQSCGRRPRNPRWRRAVCPGGVSGPGASIWKSLKSTRTSRSRITFYFSWLIKPEINPQHWKFKMISVSTQVLQAQSQTPQPGKRFSMQGRSRCASMDEVLSSRYELLLTGNI